MAMNQAAVGIGSCTQRGSKRWRLQAFVKLRATFRCTSLAFLQILIYGGASAAKISVRLWHPNLCETWRLLIILFRRRARILTFLMWWALALNLYGGLEAGGRLKPSYQKIFCLIVNAVIIYTALWTNSKSLSLLFWPRDDQISRERMKG